MLKVYHIKNGNHVVLCEIPITVDAILHYDLGGEHYVSLPFSTASPIYFSIGDYVFLDEFGYFELTEPTSPEFDGVEYKYTLKLEASYRKWKNRLLRYHPEFAASECSFSLTATIEVHAEVIKRNLKACGFTFNGEEYTYDATTYNQTQDGTNTYDITEAKLVTYQNTNILDAITAIANTFECEWWVADKTIFFGTCESVTASEDDAPVMEIGVNVAEMTSKANSATHATRLYAFGSTRNIPDNYRTEGDIDLVKDGVVTKHLLLPKDTNGGKGYVQDEDVSDDEVIEAVVVYDDIYPKVECVVDKVFTYSHTTTNDDGTQTTEIFYRVTDKGDQQFLNNFSTDLQLDGEVLHILFQEGTTEGTGRLNGMDFECNFEIYHDNDTNTDYKCVQIIANEDYGIKLPQSPSSDGTPAVLIPQTGDKFIIYNWDATKIEDTTIITAAEQELLKKAQEQLRKTKIDASTFTCTLNSDPNNWKYQMGQQIKLINTAFFKNGRMSRVIGYELKLDIPYDSPKYTIGEKPAMSRLGAIEDKLDSIQVNGNSYIYGGSGSGSGGSSIYLIKEYDSTTPNDNNAYSARRSNVRFLNKEKNDTTTHHLSIGGATINSEAGTEDDFDWTCDGFVEVTPYIQAIIEAGYGLLTEDGYEIITESGDILTEED